MQIFGGVGNGLFSVIAGACVADRLADKRRACEAQVIVGTSLALGSALGPLLAGLIIEPLGYRGTFGALAAQGAIATAIVAVRIPESVRLEKQSVNIDDGHGSPSRLLVITETRACTPG